MEKGMTALIILICAAAVVALAMFQRRVVFVVTFGTPVRAVLLALQNDRMYRTRELHLGPVFVEYGRRLP